jgi:Zn-dependent oligopeptidase
MNNTIQGFRLFEQLFNIQLREAKDLPVWHQKVKAYKIYKENKQIGSFYFDLYPRPNKYVHFACFPVKQYRLVDEGEELPVSALICNFPEGNASQPSLLEHSSVVTLFHEFGHLLHTMLARSDLASQRPVYFGMKRDFVEAPSQFLENWCWEYDALKLFARHYKTGEALPKALFDKMKQTQLVGSGIYYTRQLYQGILDLTYTDKYDSIKSQGITKVSEDLYAITQIPFAKGSHFICNFVHLNSMAALYYGYLWSKVFAQDMYSVIEKNGVMDVKSGIPYRRDVLEKSSTIEEMTLMRKFLGREPNSVAFLRNLSVN